MLTVKRKRIPLIVMIILVIILVLAAFAAGMFLKTQSEQNKMSPLDTGEVVPGIYAVNNGFVNHFLLGGDGGYIFTAHYGYTSDADAALQDWKS